MTPRLRALLLSLGVTAAGVAVYSVVPGTAPADLADAGLNACTPVDAVCPARVTSAATRASLDTTDGGHTRYRTVAMRARLCADDGGQALVLDPRGDLDVFRPDLCTWTTAGTHVAPGQLKRLAQPCGCREASGNCRIRLADGGTQPAPFGLTLEPGSFLGPGCAPKACGEVFGESSWPPECPERAP